MTSALYQHSTTLSRCSHDVNALHGDASPCQIIRNRLSIHRSHLCTLVALHVGLSARISACLLVVAINQALNFQTLYTCDEVDPELGPNLSPTKAESGRRPATFNKSSAIVVSFTGWFPAVNRTGRDGPIIFSRPVLKNTEIQHVYRRSWYDLHRRYVTCM